MPNHVSELSELLLDIYSTFREEQGESIKIQEEQAVHQHCDAELAYLGYEPFQGDGGSQSHRKGSNKSYFTYYQSARRMKR